MIFFLAACTDSGILSVIYFVKKMIELVFIILPIILIVMTCVDLFKNVMAKGEDDMKKNTNTAIKRIIYCVFAFFVPTIVNVVMNTIYDLTSSTDRESAALCWTNATKENIAMYREIEEANKQREEEQQRQDNEDKYQQNQEEIENNRPSGGLSGKDEENNESSSGSSSSGGDEGCNFKGSNLPSTKDHYTIYVGDSRTHTMCINAGVWDINTNPIKEKEDCITGPGKAYSWYSKTALEEIKKELKKHPTANIVINMGTNDVSPKLGANAATEYAKKYAELHKELASNYTMVKVMVVSITPFDEKKSGAIKYQLTNDLVEKFNNTMKENISGSRVVYCDVTCKLDGKFSTYDGIHHDADVNKLIYEEIRNCL